jgi:septal ring factor EnvC (AmiA/AmiB activator)
LSQPEPPRGPEPIDDAAPATVGELRSLRRWLVVAGVWAVAASAIAIIALLSANNNDQPKRSPGAVTGTQLTGVQRDLDQRIHALEQKLKSAPSSNDVSKLQDRLKTVENRSDSTRRDLKAVRTDLDDLKKRVAAVENQQQNNAGSGGAGTDTTTTP